jgi:hypothetical protein
MKTKHTKGEWHKRNGDIENHFEIIGDYGTHKTIALLPLRAFVEKDEAEANAKLIAAAPDMLIALQKAVEVIERMSDEYSSIANRHASYTVGESKIIEGAIKKATE